MQGKEPIIRPGPGIAGAQVALLQWGAAQSAASRIRLEVFVQEQSVPLELEMDEWDPLSLHALASDTAGVYVGTGRLLPDGHIGRMAVLRDWRRRGVGRALLDTLLHQARASGHAEAIVNAQTYVTGFYARAGFVVSSAVFEEAGIPHVEMRCQLVRCSGNSLPK